MLNRILNPEVCDATNADSSNAAGYKIPYALTTFISSPFNLISSSNFILSNIACTSGRQLPQPCPAPDAAHKAFNSVQPSAILLMIFPSPTPPQEQTSLPITGSAFLLDRNSSKRFS